MCRILGIKSSEKFDPNPHLEKFAKLSENSKEYQGHGWGLAYLTPDGWKTYHNIEPIWQEIDFDFPQVKTLLVHARSAFQDEGIEVENNMPFVHDNLAFIFNGELRGVRIREEGRIGAEKIFNFIQRFKKNGLRTAMDRAIPIIDKRSEYIRALNFIIADDDSFYISNFYNEDPAYFNLHLADSEKMKIISSQPYDWDMDWQLLDNYSVKVIQ